MGEEWFDSINLTDGETFPKALIKRTKSIVHQKIKLQHDTKRGIREIAIKNGWNTPILQILSEKRDGVFF